VYNQTPHESASKRRMLSAESKVNLNVQNAIANKQIHDQACQLPAAIPFCSIFAITKVEEPFAPFKPLSNVHLAPIQQMV
jgi:hypothetical protein